MSIKKLGKISNASFGLGGYQDCMVGLTLTFESTSEAWGCRYFIGFWSLERSKEAKWSEEERLCEIGRAGMKLAELLEKTHKKDVKQLINTPVEVTFSSEFGKMESWRLLDEVL